MTENNETKVKPMSSMLRPMSDTIPTTPQELREFVAEEFLHMASDVLARFQDLTTRINASLDIIEDSQTGGLTSTEATTFEAELTTTAERSEAIAGGPTPTPRPPARRK